jgi:hypothetical protein
MREVWGAFAVNDHLRRRAFVADVLLYDRLLVPCPDTAEHRAEWRARGWAPDALERRLEVIEGHNPDAVLRVPWTQKRSAQIRRVWARQVEVDRSRLRGNLRAAAGPYSATRRNIVDEVEAERIAHRGDRTGYLSRAMNAYGEIFPAYGSEDELAEEWHLRSPGAGAIDAQDASSPRVWRLACMFRFELFVPEESQRTDIDLLTSAVRLASDDGFRAKRASYHELRREYLDAGLHDAEVVADLEERQRAYREITANATTTSRMVTGLTIVGAGTAVAGTLTDPVLGLGTATCELCKVAVKRLRPQRQIGEAQRPVAMLYEARRALR